MESRLLVKWGGLDIMKKWICIECGKEVETHIISKDEIWNVKGIEIPCNVQVRVCSECGEELIDTKLEDENIKKVYDVYREKVGLLKSTEIKKIRDKYGISQQLFSKLLGFGEKTITRYENGSIQDTCHDNLIQLMRNEENFKSIWQNAKNKLTYEENSKIEKYFEKKLQNVKRLNKFPNYEYYTAGNVCYVTKKENDPTN